MSFTQLRYITQCGFIFRPIVWSCSGHLWT